MPVMEFESFSSPAASFFESVFHAYMNARKPNEKLDVEKIKQYIDHNYFEDISIAFFMEKYYLSKEHLLRLFKQKYGCGIYEYTLNVRMQRAKELLADPTLKIQMVSEKVGYHDTNYFSKAFKKQFHISPQEYRNTL